MFGRGDVEISGLRATSVVLQCPAPTGVTIMGHRRGDRAWPQVMGWWQRAQCPGQFSPGPASECPERLQGCSGIYLGIFTLEDGIVVLLQAVLLGEAQTGSFKQGRPFNRFKWASL